MNNYNIEHFKKLSSEEILNKIKEDKSNAFINVIEEEPFKGQKIIGIKDIHTQTKTATTVGSNVLQNFHSPYSSTVVDLLEKADFKIVGTLNLDEFAMGYSNERSYFGGVTNSLNEEYVPGGSSGGSAVAVAKGLIPIATGTDTGGSIRQPAALNGIYGMKPTYGLVSRYGTVAFASSFDTIGLLSNTIEDNATTLEVLAKNDPRDLTNYVPDGYTATDLIDSDDKLKIGYVKEWVDRIEDKGMKDAILKQVNIFKEKGYEVEEVSLPSSIYAFELYMILAYSEGSSNLSRYDGIKFGEKNTTTNFSEYRLKLGDEVKKRLVMGAYMTCQKHSNEYYNKALKIRTKIKQEFKNIFKDYDILLGPVTPLEGIKKSESVDSKVGYTNDLFLIPANLAGIPAMSVPIANGKDNLKIGIQVLADKYEENKIYNIAKKIETWRKEDE